MTGTRAPLPVCSGMDKARKVWLVHNESSGSNDEAALDALRDAFGIAGLERIGETCFPRDQPPKPVDLDRCGADTLAIFAGDGTISSVTAGVVGWSGTVLPLPGGTMNMLSRRLHGDATGPEIIDRFQHGVVTKVRPTVLRSRHATGLTGALSGPGTAWAHVREAMRDVDVKELISTASDAISASTAGTKVICLDTGCGREEGYTAITLTPQDDGIEVAGYYTQSLADYARHGVALLQRDFRNGPHEVLGRREQVRLACVGGEPMGLLIDGEPYEGSVEETFEIGTSDVDFWATASKE
jgi:hypothetical protein